MPPNSQWLWVAPNNQRHYIKINKEKIKKKDCKCNEMKRSQRN